MSNFKNTLVLGASDNPNRYSYKAIKMLRAHGHTVIGIGKKKGKVSDVTFNNLRPHPNTLEIDTITLYLNPKHQALYYDYILALHPDRIIFNHGAENPELYRLPKENNIMPVEACTLVLLSTGQY